MHPAPLKSVALHILFAAWLALTCGCHVVNDDGDPDTSGGGPATTKDAGPTAKPAEPCASTA